jgi:hypothetical protein
MPGMASDEAEARESGGEALHCDFCGSRVPRVRRVALDGDYERLQTPHRVRYACPECSEAKERERGAGLGGPGPGGPGCG